MTLVPAYEATSIVLVGFVGLIVEFELPFPAAAAATAALAFVVIFLGPCKNVLFRVVVGGGACPPPLRSSMLLPPHELPRNHFWVLLPHATHIQYVLHFAL